MRRKTDANNPADWLLVAQADLVMVRLTCAQEVSFDPCRAKLAEALEKILKAELIRLGWRLEKTHDLQRLTGLLKERGSDLISAVEPLANVLADAYFMDRYPGFDLDEPDWPQLRQQMKEVEDLLTTVKSRLPHPGS